MADNTLCSISQLDEATSLNEQDYFIVSQANDDIYTGYESKKISFKDLQTQISVTVNQEISSVISKISGDVSITNTVTNNVNGILNQSINNILSQISGSVTITDNITNYVTGDLNQTIQNVISEVIGDVDVVTSLSTIVYAISADITQKINNAISGVEGDVSSVSQIQNQVEAVYSKINNEIETNISHVSGDVNSAVEIANDVKAQVSEISNSINTLITDCENVSSLVSIQNTVNAHESIINTLTNTLAYYPIIHLTSTITNTGVKIYILNDKQVNVINVKDNNPIIIQFPSGSQTIQTYAEDYYVNEYGEIETNSGSNSLRISRDFELTLQINSDVDQVNISWQTNEDEDNKINKVVSPEDSSIMTDFNSGVTYLYYFSEVDNGVLYANRHTLQEINLS